jgi:hypothetical protein
VDPFEMAVRAIGLAVGMLAVAMLLVLGWVLRWMWLDRGGLSWPELLAVVPPVALVVVALGLAQWGRSR